MQQADAPNTALIPESDAVGVTVVLITCTYRGQEFIRIGYYVNNEYTDTELRENPPLKPDYGQVCHHVSYTLKFYSFSSICVLAIGNIDNKNETKKYHLIFHIVQKYNLETDSPLKSPWNQHLYMEWNVAVFMVNDLSMNVLVLFVFLIHASL